MNLKLESPAQPRSSRRRWFAGLASLGGLGLVATQVPAHGWGRGALDPEERTRRLEYRIGLQAMADAAEVLTPQQRAAAAARMKARMQHRLGG